MTSPPEIFARVPTTTYAVPPHHLHLPGRNLVLMNHARKLTSGRTIGGPAAANAKLHKRPQSRIRTLELASPARPAHGPLGASFFFVAGKSRQRPPAHLPSLRYAGNNAGAPAASGFSQPSRVRPDAV